MSTTAGSSVDLSVGTILARTRDRLPLDATQIAWFIASVVDGTVSRAQAAAWLAFVYLNGLDETSTVALTDIMTRSGECLVWPRDGRPVVDKHSTGGVGDKVSLILAPLWAELGWRVPMISGRGLEHTGGTLDKLESIPGFRVDLDNQALNRVLAQVGCFISGQTTALAPADRILYGLRDETNTVASLPLITSSILSKKLAEGLDRLVLDVKYGTGAFLKTREQALELARMMERVSAGLGTPAKAFLNPMNVPLGNKVGNALEVEEAIQCLRGEGPEDLHQIVVQLTDHPDADGLLRSGRVLARFERMVEAQGGKPGAPLLGLDSVRRAPVLASRSGRVTGVDALLVGQAAFRLGAGRARAGDPVHPGVGVEVLVKPGAKVDVGQPLFIVAHAERNFDFAVKLLRDSVSIESLDSAPS